MHLLDSVEGRSDETRLDEEEGDEDQDEILHLDDGVDGLEGH